MTTTPPGLGDGRGIDAYTLPADATANPVHSQTGLPRHAIQTPPGAGPLFPAGWSTTDGSPMSLGTPALPFRPSLEPRSWWLADALSALEAIDDEIAEDGLPEIGPAARKEAKRVLAALARHPQDPTVYPTQDGEIAIQFQSRRISASVVILIDNHGRAECYAYTGGRSRRSHYDVASDLPDGFVMEQLHALRPERMPAQRTSGGLEGSATMLLAGPPTWL